MLNLYIFKLGRKIIMRVGYLGPKGTFSYEVCNNYYENREELVEYKTISDTIIALEKENIDECIVPIENSIQGCVTDSIDTLIQNIDIFVTKEIIIDINQNLMANKKYDFDEIEIIYSHPQAISQCKNFLSNNFPNAKIEAIESTAYAAKIVSQSSEKIACISNISCLKEYNLCLIKENIQDKSFNKTKFWVLSKIKNDINSNISKMSMIFSVKDKPGALYNVLRIFNEYDLNLTKIESRPAKTVMGEYFFLIDVTIDNIINADNAIKKLKENGIFCRILGRY